MSPRLALHFLGPPQIQLDGNPVSLERRKMAALLAYLALEREPQPRASLSALLWPEYTQSNAFKNLRHTLWEIQQSLGEHWLTASRENIGLKDGTDLWLDTAQFDSLLEQARLEPDASLRASLLADSAALYRNHFLSGFSLKDAPTFNDWAYAVSEEYRRKLAKALSALAETYCALGEAERAIPHARRLVSLDPLEEAAHRRLMEVYVQAGQHSAALKQYQTLEQTLRQELNLDPQPETRDLYRRIRKGEAKPVPVEKRAAPAAKPQHNLPAQLTSFIGREQGQFEIAQLLEKHRLVSLVGAGGIGKTSLALNVGHKLLNEYPGGVWFIALDSLSNPALVPQTAAAVFDIREGSGQPVTELLTNALRAKNAVLILDNCEHLLEACAQLADELLRDCPHLKILATSREPLGIAGEAIYHMPSLTLPDQGVEALEQLAEYEAMRLFAERAALAQSAFQLTRENVRAVAEICRKVDGVPLAIELAAARVNMLQAEEILAQLNESFALLASDSRSLAPRHLTLQASMDWSWSLLEEAERVFLRQLSVFAGGWTLDSARAVCDGDALGLTGALVKKSLIVVDQASGRGTRYRFHEIVRAYALRRLVGSGEEEKIRDRHVKFFLELSAQAEMGMRGPSLVNWMERLDEERNNFRAALHWANQKDVEAGLYLSGRLLRYWESANLPEGRQWLKTFLEKPKSKNFLRARAQALQTHSWLLTWLQEFDQAYAAAEESLQLFRATGDRAGEVDALISVGNILQFKDKMKASVEIGEEALALSRSIGDRWREANALNYLGWGYADDSARRFGYWEQAIRLYREVGDQICLANNLGVLGQFQVMHGDLDGGEKNLDEALVLWQANKKANVWENPKVAKSLIAFIRGQYEQAHALLEEVLHTTEQTGNIMGYLWAQVRLGFVEFHAGNFSEARRLLGDSARDFLKGQNTIGVVFALEGLAGLDATVGKIERAARLIGCADAMREKVRDMRPAVEQADVDMSIAACMARMGEAAFSDAYDEGVKMSLEQAVELALGED